MNRFERMQMVASLRSSGLGALADEVEERLKNKHPKTEGGKLDSLASVLDEVMAMGSGEAYDQLVRRQRAVQRVRSVAAPSTDSVWN